VNRYDQAARYSFRSDPLGFLRWVVPGLDRALRFQSWLDTRTLPFPGTSDRTCDTVADLADAITSLRRWALVTEFQTEPDPEILDRLLEYLARLRRELRWGPQRREKYQVVAALVSLTGPPQPDILEMTLPSSDSSALRLQVTVRTLRDEDAALTLAQIAAGETSRSVLSWISLMRGGNEPGIIDKWKLVADQEHDEERRADSRAIVIVFAELTGCAAIWKSGLEGWNMRESTIVSEWMAEGEAKGIAKGIAEARRSDLVEVLGQRFGAPIPADLVATIEGQADTDVLSCWFKAALKSQTLDAFRAELAG
jgi:hypothetical protein